MNQEQQKDLVYALCAGVIAGIIMSPVITLVAIAVGFFSRKLYAAWLLERIRNG